jgi:thiol-disulfide isomerase/thioredoxin
MLDKILDRAASIAIITASIVFLGVAAYKYLIINNHYSTLPAKVPIGKKLDLPNINWEGNGLTVLIALQTKCPFCRESAPFYQRLHREFSGKQNISLVTVFPEPVENSREYLKALEVPFNEIRESSLSSIGVSVTPTLLVVDKTGTVIHGWLGKLPSEKESKVIALLAKVSQSNKKV